MVFRILIISFLYLNFCYGQEAIEINQKFNSNKIYKYQIIRGEIDSRKPNQENLNIITDVTLKVKKEKKNIFHLSWTYENSTTQGVDFNLLDEKSKKQINIYKGFRIDFSINENGQLIEFLNFPECKSKLKEIMKNQYIESNSNYITESEISNFLIFLNDSMYSPEILISTYFPEINLFFSMNGENIDIKKTKIENAEIPNPFGGPSFNSIIETKTEKINDSNYIIVCQQSIEKKELNQKLEETFKNISKNTGKPFNDEDVQKFNIASSTKYEYNITEKIIAKIIYQKRINSKDIEKVQLLEIKLN